MKRVRDKRVLSNTATRTTVHYGVHKKLESTLSIHNGKTHSDFDSYKTLAVLSTIHKYNQTIASTCRTLSCFAVSLLPFSLILRHIDHRPHLKNATSHNLLLIRNIMTTPSLQSTPSNSVPLFRSRRVVVATILLISALYYYLFGQIFINKSNEISTTSTDSLIAAAAPNPLFCQDNNITVLLCNCHDPATAYMYKRQIWRAHHERMKQQAASAVNTLSGSIVFLGDAIFERLNGTRMNGHQNAYLANKKLVFDQYFSRSSANNNTAGIILASSGDTTGHWLWHLQNGVLSESLQPAVFVILLGTHNMGRDGCNRQTTLAGIVQVMQLVHQQKPASKILLHGLLPCRDQKPFSSYSNNHNELKNRFALGEQWQNTVWINAQLQKTCDKLKYCAYMDSGTLFLSKNGTSIQEEFMPDAMHPSLAGYKLWVPRIHRRLELM